MVTAFVYILYSKSIKKHYIGFTTESILIRVDRHNSNYYDGKFTTQGKPWELVFSIECKDEKLARKIENHIKAMKSSKYIENLINYPEISEKLIARYL
ncbi:MAG: GIY-YIG nuclease family protein [Bacteroidota bacterium]|nr:GIY-YIG nuclease family protein [Bacteroidota bacterium]